MSEQVLVITSQAMEEAGSVAGVSKNFAPFLYAVQQHGLFIPREEAEYDPSFKQVIPYMLIHRVGKAGRVARFFSYSRGRGQGEKRLHGKYSIGIGGHVCREDGSTNMDAFMEGMVRELREELDLNYTAIWPIGVVYDATTSVGRVHLGFLHACRVETTDVYPLEEDILDAEFLSKKQLYKLRSRYESWSQFCITTMNTVARCWPPDKREEHK